MFATACGAAYASLVGNPKEAKAVEGADGQGNDSAEHTAASAASQPSVKTDSKLEKKPGCRDMLVGSFRAECEQHCRQELEARVVALVSEGGHA